MIGLKDGCELPAPLQDTIEFPPDPSTSNIPTESNDPCFPFENGPGHKDATPQQLRIMRQMLDAVNISSFRPDFSKSASSKENKWMWNVCLEIIYKLVECAEYNGVAVGGKNDTVIRKCLNTYTQSLSKRYRYSFTNHI